jgi:hypothetical protein
MGRGSTAASQRRKNGLEKCLRQLFARAKFADLAVGYPRL